MQERITASIEIGGKLRRTQVEVLIEAILADHPCWEYGEPSITHLSWDELDRVDESLSLVDDTARNGEFPEIERVAAELGLTFVRRSEGASEFNPEVAWFTPGMTEIRVAVTDCNHHPVIEQSEAEKALRMMKGRRFAAAQEYLHNLMVRIPKVPPLTIAD